VAIYASGDLSHYPGLYNAGWIDQPLDRWILKRLEALQHLFTFDTDNLRSGTGEVRAWIRAAAAMKRPAKVVETVHLSSGSGRSWNLTTLLVVPFPPSTWKGVRVA
jgi:protocatechuate 4,5-dioxygenase beta chain